MLSRRRPQELVKGHSVHMAIEFSNLFRVGLARG